MVEGYTTDPMQVAIPGAFVLVKGTSQWGAECELATLDNTSTISVKRGTAEIHGKGAPILLQKGQTLRLEAGQQSGEKVAGRISKEIPQGKIQRMGQAEDLPLQLNQVIDWNDLLQTLEKGRAQIKLLDGSTLNVGARSELRIIKHDPEAQQTQLELTLGEVQANVQKITTPGGKFELRTKSAVIGTIDTSYVAETDGNQTKICGVDGTTLVGSTDPNITKTVKLLKNQCTTVMPGAPPTDPVFSPQEVAQMLNHTSIAGTGGAVGTSAGSAGAAGGAAGAAGGLPNWVWVAAGAAAGAAGGAITGIIVSSGGTTSPTTP